MKTIVQVRFATGWGEVKLLAAEVLREYPSLNSVRVRLISNGQCRNVHPTSIVRTA
jgi:hypothetical protein